MLRIALLISFVLGFGGLKAVAQDSGLPAPPKPPKSKAKEAEKAENSPSDSAPSAAPTPRSDERGHHLDARPRRIRIDVPFFHMDLDLGGRGAARQVMPDSPPAQAAPKNNAA